MRITSPYIDEHEDYQVVSPHAVRVFPLWILLYLKHQETTSALLKAIGNDEDLPQLDDENQNVA